MRIESSRWQSAERGHAEAVAALLVAASLVPDHKWTEPLGRGRWSAAQVLLHVEQSYRLGADALQGGEGMRVKVSPLTAWLGRSLVLPLITFTKRFPRNAPAPRCATGAMYASHTRTSVRSRRTRRCACSTATRGITPSCSPRRSSSENRHPAFRSWSRSGPEGPAISSWRRASRRASRTSPSRTSSPRLSPLASRAAADRSSRTKRGGRPAARAGSSRRSHPARGRRRS